MTPLPRSYVEAKRGGVSDIGSDSDRSGSTEVAQRASVPQTWDDDVLSLKQKLYAPSFD